MSVLTQPPTMGDVLKYELNPNFTRETVTLLAGTNYPVGAVLGRITASGKMKLSTVTGTWLSSPSAGLRWRPSARGASNIGKNSGVT